MNPCLILMPKFYFDVSTTLAINHITLEKLLDLCDIEYLICEVSMIIASF